MRLGAVRLVRGHREILDELALLGELADRTGHGCLLRDMPYYLAKPGLFKRTPVLLLVGAGHVAGFGKRLSAREVQGAVLLFEYNVAGLPARMYTSNDRSGRRSLIAPPEIRPQVAALASEHLLEHGAHVVMLSFRSSGTSDETCATLSRTTPYSSWVARQREVPDYLSLGDTFDETLAALGKRTRTHMRYYRRRAEAKIGCFLDTDPRITARDAVEFNRVCMYSVADELAAWRLNALRDFEDPILMAVRDRDGRLLSVIGGRRAHGDSEIFWQMNRADLPTYSLSLVMRTYLIEHEVSRGARRVYFDGGLSHSISNSFVTGNVTDLAVLRRTPMAFLARKLARRMIPSDNELGRLLAS